MSIENMIGLTVESFEKSGDDWKLKTDKGTVTLHAEGECCSSSWLETPEDSFQELIGAKIETIEEVYGESTNSSEYDVLQTYFFKIKTTHGDVTLEMRNSSNGYYGGWLQASIEP